MLRLASVRQLKMKMEEDDMMPLVFANVGEENIIRKVGGSAEIKKHLEDLGFVVGGNVTVVSAIAGNLIVNVKDSRIAISREMAGKIML
jgi:ferrous iron transport protein A